MLIYFCKVMDYKGLQEQVILAGSYFLNPWFAKLEMVKMTEIRYRPCRRRYQLCW